MNVYLLITNGKHISLITKQCC